MSGSHCDLGACIMGLTQRSSAETVIGIGTVRAWWSFTGDSPPVVLLPSRRGIPSRCAADFTYVPMACGFGYTAFVVDAYAGLIAGWECSLRKDTGFVERALRHAAAEVVDAARDDGVIPNGGELVAHRDGGRGGHPVVRDDGLLRI